MRSALYASLVVAVVAAPSYAAIIRVPAEAITIQAGIDAASAGDTVLVASGTYTGPGNRDIDFGGTDIVLLSEEGAWVTTIDCEASGRGFVFHTFETPAALIQGFTVQNADAGGSFGGALFINMASPTIRECVFSANHGNQGGGIYLEQSSSLVEGCEFTGNTAANWGGGFVCKSGSSAILDNCTFSSNAAARGGGGYVRGGSTLSLVACTFESNHGTNSAGAVYCTGSDLAASSCTFTDNSAGEGGAVYCADGAGASLDGCTFSMNTATSFGGGIHCEDSGTLRLTECIFEANTTTSGTEPGNGGAAIYCDHISLCSMFNCEFVDNHAYGDDSYGGAVSLRFASTTQDTISGCTFSGNSADLSGGAVYQQSYSLRIASCTFTGNSVSDAGFAGGGALESSGALELTDCEFSGNHSASRGGGVLTGGPITMTDCTFIDNAARDGGGVCLFSGQNSINMISDTVLSSNSAATGGGFYLRTNYSSSQINISGCTLDGNTSAAPGGGLHIESYGDGAVTLSNCTLVNNSADAGSGLNVSAAQVVINNSIFAHGSEGEAIRCIGNGFAVLGCTDVFGNAGGDWIGCIADQFGINGNFSASPLFCDYFGGDYTLAEASPCAPDNAPAGCGLIGALPVACLEPITVMDRAPTPPRLRLRVSPNPISSHSVVDWTNEEAAQSVFRLFNARGRLVLSHDLGRRPFGAQSFTWNEILGGRELVSGVYFLELQRSPGTKTAARIVVIR